MDEQRINALDYYIYYKIRIKGGVENEESI